jgi:hypothetical protein
METIIITVIKSQKNLQTNLQKNLPQVTNTHSKLVNGERLKSFQP